MRVPVLDCSHFTAALFLLQLSIYIQVRLDWVCVHSIIRMKVQLYWESSINYRAVALVERKKKKKEHL